VCYSDEHRVSKFRASGAQFTMPLMIVPRSKDWHSDNIQDDAPSSQAHIQPGIMHSSSEPRNFDTRDAITSLEYIYLIFRKDTCSCSCMFFFFIIFLLHFISFHFVFVCDKINFHFVTKCVRFSKMRFRHFANTVTVLPLSIFQAFFFKLRQSNSHKSKAIKSK